MFFACGACRILAHAFLKRYGTADRRVPWIRPAAGFPGNHIVIDRGDWIFDHHGYSRPAGFLAHTRAKAARWWPGWQAALVELPRDVLVSETASRTHDGLWLREPGQFLHDPMPRARAFLDRFPPPPDDARSTGASRPAAPRLGERTRERAIERSDPT